jgi:hypothetical protein
MVRNAGRVTRFVVMAVLQAARARSLGLSEESAFSWGLNRAIFYAAAKQGFGQSSPPGEQALGATKAGPSREVFRLGQDEAFRSPNFKEPIFTIGGEDQTPERFEQAVVSRFGTKENFRAAWDEAIRIVAGFDRATVESPRGFYGEVYKPRRDELSDAWTQRFSPPPRSGRQPRPGRQPRSTS